MLKPCQKEFHVRRLLPILLLSACVALPESTTGLVTAVNERSVTIQGRFSADGSVAHPTAAMVAQAQDVCPGARYLSAKATEGNLDTFDYLFLCH